MESLTKRINRLAGEVRKHPDRIVTIPARGVTAKIVQTAGLLPYVGFAERRFIIFLVPRRESITGGILSIFNLYKFSRELAAVHNARVFMCHYPGEGGFASHYTMFDNDVTIYPLEWVLAMCRRAESIQLHIPEYALQRVVEKIGTQELARLRSKHGLRVNILNQNVMAMPEDAFLERLRRLAPERLTCTAAHTSYCTAENRRRWEIPMHHLPAWTYPDEAHVTNYEAKRDLIIVSPDRSPHRKVVLEKIAADLPNLEIRVISGMRFPDYLKLARSAKWSLTFGEGLDDYFLSTFQHGGVGFAVYNQEFFTPEYKSLGTVYPDWETLATRITAEIKALDSKQAMEPYSAQGRAIINRVWSRDKTMAALEAFYRGNFTLP